MTDFVETKVVQRVDLYKADDPIGGQVMTLARNEDKILDSRVENLFDCVNYLARIVTSRCSWVNDISKRPRRQTQSIL